MEIVIGIVHMDQSQNVIVHEAKNRDSRVDKTEEDQVHLGCRLTLTGCKETDQTAGEVDDVVCRIHFEPQEHVTDKEAGDTDECQNETEQCRNGLGNHGKRGKK